MGRDYSSFLVHTPGIQTEPAAGIQHEGPGTTLWLRDTNTTNEATGFDYQCDGAGVGLSYKYTNTLSPRIGFSYDYAGSGTSLELKYSSLLGSGIGFKLDYAGLGHALFLDYTNENSTAPAIDLSYNTGSQGIGVYGVAAIAGRFDGNVDINGTLSKSSGTFKIDHRLDPANKYLYHSFVESSDMMNIYNGNATLNGSGDAWVELPEWFGALNDEYRYQLTCVGEFAPVYIAEKIQNNRFRIAGGAPGLEVS